MDLDSEQGTQNLMASFSDKESPTSILLDHEVDDPDCEAEAILSTGRADCDSRSEAF